MDDENKYIRIIYLIAWALEHPFHHPENFFRRPKQRKK